MDYIKITDYAAKDNLLTGNPAKLVKGTELGAEFDAIQTAVATKADSLSPVLTTPQINDTSSDHQYIVAVSELAADRTVTLPLLTGDDTFVFNSHAATLTNKTVNLSSNTLTGTLAQFNTALSDADFASLAGSETLTNKTLTSPAINGTVTTTGLTLPALTLGGAITGNSQNISGLGTLGCGAITSSGAIAGSSLNIGTGALTAGSGSFGGTANATGITIQPLAGGGNYSAIYSNANTPSGTNYSVLINATSTYISGSSASGLIVGGNTIVNATSTGLAVTGQLVVSNNNNISWGGSYGAGIPTISANSGAGMYFYPNGSTSGLSMTIDASGNLLHGTTVTNPISSRVNGNVFFGTGGFQLRTPTASSIMGLNATSGTHITFYTDNGSAVSAGVITSSGSVTSYTGTSDYRLKDEQQSITGAEGIAFVSALKPKRWIWTTDSRPDAGFVAHELAEVSQNSVFGEKDAVDGEGKPVYQSADPSSPEIMANLVAAMQELTTRLTALEAK